MLFEKADAPMAKALSAFLDEAGQAPYFSLKRLIAEGEVMRPRTPDHPVFVCHNRFALRRLREAQETASHV